MSDIKSKFEAWFLSIPDVDETLLEASSGISDCEYFYSHIEQMYVGYVGGAREYDKLTAQVAELRAALLEVIKIDESIHCYEDGETLLCNVEAKALEAAE